MAIRWSGAHCISDFGPIIEITGGWENFNGGEALIWRSDLTLQDMIYIIHLTWNNTSNRSQQVQHSTTSIPLKPSNMEPQSHSNVAVCGGNPRWGMAWHPCFKWGHGAAITTLSWCLEGKRWDLGRMGNQKQADIGYGRSSSAVYAHVALYVIADWKLHDRCSSLFPIKNSEQLQLVSFVWLVSGSKRLRVSIPRVNIHTLSPNSFLQATQLHECCQGCYACGCKLVKPRYSEVCTVVPCVVPGSLGNTGYFLCSWWRCPAVMIVTDGDDDLSILVNSKRDYGH